MSAVDAMNVIWLFVIGTAIGNYATSVVYRFPKGVKLFEKNPFCSNCGTPLAVRDLFPVFSWVFLGGKARCCGAKIPAIYPAVEISYAAILILNYFLFGNTTSSILLSGIGFIVLLCAILHIRDNIIDKNLLLLIFIMGSWLQIIIAGDYFPIITGALIGLIAILITLRHYELVEKSKKTIYDMPPELLLITVISASLGFSITAIIIAIILVLLIFKPDAHLHMKNFMLTLIYSCFYAHLTYALFLIDF